MSGLLKRLKTIMFIAFAFLPSAAFGYDVYIPTYFRNRRLLAGYAACEQQPPGTSLFCRHAL